MKTNSLVVRWGDDDIEFEWRDRTLRSRVFANAKQCVRQKGQSGCERANVVRAMTSSAHFIVKRRNIQTQDADVIFFFLWSQLFVWFLYRFALL